MLDPDKAAADKDHIWVLWAAAHDPHNVVVDCRPSTEPADITALYSCFDCERKKQCQRTVGCLHHDITTWFGVDGKRGARVPRVALWLMGLVAFVFEAFVPTPPHHTTPRHTNRAHEQGARTGRTKLYSKRW